MSSVVSEPAFVASTGGKACSGSRSICQLGCSKGDALGREQDR